MCAVPVGRMVALLSVTPRWEVDRPSRRAAAAQPARSSRPHLSAPLGQQSRQPSRRTDAGAVDQRCAATMDDTKGETHTHARAITTPHTRTHGHMHACVRMTQQASASRFSIRPPNAASAPLVPAVPGDKCLTHATLPVASRPLSLQPEPIRRYARFHLPHSLAHSLPPSALCLPRWTS